MNMVRFLLCSLISMAFLMPCKAAPQSSRADYLRATLPYDTECLLGATIRVRNVTKEDVRGLTMMEQGLLEDLLRLNICLNDPSISDKDKAYARDVLPHVVVYAQKHDLAAGYVRGKVYEMLPGDVIFPATMKIRDVYETIVIAPATAH